MATCSVLVILLLNLHMGVVKYQSSNWMYIIYNTANLLLISKIYNWDVWSLIIEMVLLMRSLSIIIP